MTKPDLDVVDAGLRNALVAAVLEPLASFELAYFFWLLRMLVAYHTLTQLAAVGKPKDDDKEENDGASHTLEQLAAVGSVSSPLTANRASTPPLPAPVQPLPPRSVPSAGFSEKTHRALLEALPDAMVVINSDGAIEFVNVQTEKMFGYTREELLGQTIELLVPERFRPGHVELRRRYFAKPESRPMGIDRELFGRRKDGSLFPVEISLSPIHTETGILVTSAIRDLSQREREAAKFRTLVENIPAVTFIAPLDESVPELYVSPQIEALLGFTTKEWIEDPVLWHRQLHPEDRERWNREFAPTCASGKPFNSIYRFLAKDGHTVWIHGSARMVRDTEGKLLFLQGVAFDISAIKEAEEVLKRHKEDLERLVEERTRELQRSLSELEEKTKELKEKAEELADFAYHSSHDLKEPLRSLANFPKYLARDYGGKLGEDGNKWIKYTMEGANRMRQLIETLLEYSRVVKRDRVLKPVNCLDCARRAVADLEAAIEESGAQVTLSELPTVKGNHAKLTLLFQNLLGNAVKFRDPERPIRVEIGARPEGDNWLFWVQDNGIGIESKFLEKIFGLSTRVARHHAKYPGYGYGLHIAMKVVTGHGGRIWAESQLGQGSTFYFTLPALPPVEEE